MRPVERLLRKPIRRARRGRQRRRLAKDTIGKRRAHERWVAEIRAQEARWVAEIRARHEDKR